MTEEPPVLPVYIVTSTNWTMEVPMDEYNVQFDKEAQILEAATRAIETWKGMRDDLTIKMNADSQDEKAQLGTTVLVHVKGENPDNHAIIFTHICMGNTGLYKDAQVMKEKLEEQMASLRKKQEERVQREQQIREFEELKEMLDPTQQKQIKKPRKPKK